jgi:hypothetical protein
LAKVSFTPRHILKISEKSASSQAQVLSGADETIDHHRGRERMGMGIRRRLPPRLRKTLGLLFWIVSGSISPVRFSCHCGEPAVG